MKQVSLVVGCSEKPSMMATLSLSLFEELADSTQSTIYTSCKNTAVNMTDQAMICS